MVISMPTEGLVQATNHPKSEPSIPCGQFGERYKAPSSEYIFYKLLMCEATSRGFFIAFLGALVVLHITEDEFGTSHISPKLSPQQCGKTLSLR